MKRFDVLQELKKNYNHLTGSQKAIGKYILENYREIAFMSAIELGEKVGVSDATIIRFARSIGFNGFTELKNHIRQGMKNFDSPDKRLSKQFDILDDKDNQSIQVGKRDLENLENFLLHIESEKIEQAANALLTADTIFLIGAGSSGILIDFLAMHLRRMGFKVIAISEGGIPNTEKIIPINERDLLIACSFPRYLKSTYNALLFARKKGARTITITDSNFSTIIMNSDIVFSLPIDNTTFFNSYIVPMELCNILVMTLLEKNKEEIYIKLKQNVQGMEIFDLRL